MYDTRAKKDAISIEYYLFIVKTVFMRTGFYEA